MKAPCREIFPRGTERTARLACMEEPPSLHRKKPAPPPGLIQEIPDVEQTAGPTFYRIMGFHALASRQRRER